jgi:hypothetical protein
MLASAAELGARCQAAAAIRSWPEVAASPPLRLAAGLHGRRPRVHGLARGRGFRPRFVVEPAHDGMVDAIHLSRTGGSPADLAGVPAAVYPQRPALRRPVAAAATNEAIIQEARRAAAAGRRAAVARA